MQTVYRYWAALVFLAVLLQVAFAGYGAFSVANDVDDGGSVNEDRFEDVWGLHASWGYIVILGALILLVIALIARLGKRRVLHTAGLFGLLVLQWILAMIGFDVPGIGALHPVNALFIFAMSGWLAATSWRAARTLGRATA